MHDFPAPCLFPKYDYDKIYADAPSIHCKHLTSPYESTLIVSLVGFGEIYKNYEIDNEKGAIVVIRPDGCGSSL